MSTSTRICLLATLLMSGACTVEETPIPPLTGPSELGLRIALQVTPDSILQDGGSQAVLNIEATGPDGRPVRGLTLRVEALFDGIVQDFGTVSAKTVVTGDDGRARVTYTAPPRPSESVDQPNVITFRVTPIGADFTGEVGRTATLRLVTPGVLLPPNSAPVGSFTFTPPEPQILTSVVFDASTSTDEGVACGARCTYAWDFGDGSTGSGIFVTHSYQRTGTYLVRLTVTDPRGASNSTTQSLTAQAGPPPTDVARFTISPTSPVIGQTVFLNAEAARAAPGRRIVSYQWDFGSGQTGSGMTTSTSYSRAGTYTVVLTVTDDAGQQTTETRTVTVSAPTPSPPGAIGTALTASLTGAPTEGTTATLFAFDASGSRPGALPIIEYRYDFGDFTTDVVGTSPTASHRFSVPGLFRVTVAVRDSAGGTAISPPVTITVR